MSERDLRREARANGRDRREEIKAEWEALGMATRIQSPVEMRRVLMTWTKEKLVGFLIRAESDEIKARHKMLNAWSDANQIREQALILPRETKSRDLGAGDNFSAWLVQKHGQTIDAKTVFMAGWDAHSRAASAIDDDPS